MMRYSTKRMIFVIALLAMGLGTLVTAVRGSLWAFVPLSVYVALLFLSVLYDVKYRKQL